MVDYAFTEFRAPDINPYEEGAFPPSEEEFMNALSLWVVCQCQPNRITVRAASAAWRAPEALIADAINSERYWMYLSVPGQDGTPVIQLEGV